MQTLPSTLGEVQLSDTAIIIHCANSLRFDPIVCWQKPQEHKPIPPQGDVLPMPISLLPSTSFIPREYQLHICSQICAQCGTKHEWTRMYAHNNIEARLGFDRPISNLVPVDHFSYNVPVRVLRAPQKQVPACHECIGSFDLSDLPRPSDTAAYKKIIAAFQNPGNIVVEQTAKPAKGGGASSSTVKSKKPEKTIDSLLDF